MSPRCRPIPRLVPVLVALLAAPGCIGADPGEEGESGRELRDDLRPGLLAESAGVRAVVPEPGWGLFAEVIGADGHTRALTLETDLDGAVYEVVGEPVEVSSGAAATPCSDGAYHLAGYRWNETLHWTFRASTTPGYLEADAVEAALRGGTANITRAYNSCNLADTVSARAHYDGRADIGPNILGDGTCGSPDGRNAVSFGSLPDDYLAIACTWYSNGVALEADIRLNRGDYRWYTSKPEGCSHRFDIRGVMTHERGHSFGLGHVSEASHPSLTMSEAIAPCDNSARTLGLGDVRALRAIY